MSYNAGQGRARYVPGAHRLHSPSIPTNSPRLSSGHQHHNPFNSPLPFQVVAPGMVQNNRNNTAQATEPPKLSRSEIMAQMVNATGPQHMPQPQTHNQYGGAARGRVPASATYQPAVRTAYGAADDDTVDEDGQVEMTKSTKRKRHSKRYDEDADDEDYQDVGRRSERKAKRQANQNIQMMSAAMTPTNQQVVDNSDDPYVPSTITAPEEEPPKKGKGKCIPVPRCLAEAGEADLMMWKYKHAGKGWAEINERWEEITGIKPGRSTLSVRWLKLNENFSVNENANDILLFSCREKAEKKMENNLWSCAADIMREESGLYHPPDVLKKRYLYLKELEFDLTRAKKKTIKEMEEESQNDNEGQIEDGSSQPTAPMMSGGLLPNTMVQRYQSPYSQSHSSNSMPAAHQTSPAYNMAVNNMYSPRTMSAAHPSGVVGMQPVHQMMYLQAPVNSPQVANGQGYYAAQTHPQHLSPHQGYDDSNNLFVGMHAYADYYDGRNHNQAALIPQANLPEQQPAAVDHSSFYDVLPPQEKATAEPDHVDIKQDYEDAIAIEDHDQHAEDTTVNSATMLVAYDSDTDSE